MIIDSLDNLEQYKGVLPHFDLVADYIKTTQLTEAEPGTTIVAEGKVKAIISNGNAKTQEVSLQKFECHDQNIDVQVCISGVETIGWKYRADCTTPNGAYNPEKDVQFYSDAPTTYFTLNAGQFVIFYPNDVHAPMIGEGTIKKLVLKVKI